MIRVLPIESLQRLMFDMCEFACMIVPCDGLTPHTSLFPTFAPVASEIDSRPPSPGCPNWMREDETHV